MTIFYKILIILYMKWLEPPVIKIYEALWAIADNRIKVENYLNFYCAKNYSSSKWKYYISEFDTNSNSIVSNDNWSYWKWYLWYPSIALLFKIWVLDLNIEYANSLKI